jgi:hypothetical protein
LFSTNHWLLQGFADGVGDHPRHRIHAAAGRTRHQQADRMIGIVAGDCTGRAQHQQRCDAD